MASSMASDSGSSSGMAMGPVVPKQLNYSDVLPALFFLGNIHVFSQKLLGCSVFGIFNDF